jgi:hypothetical protein
MYFTGDIPGETELGDIAEPLAEFFTRDVYPQHFDL